MGIRNPIRELREAIGMSVVDFAGVLGKSECWLRKMERGEEPRRLRKRVLEALGAIGADAAAMAQRWDDYQAQRQEAAIMEARSRARAVSEEERAHLVAFGGAPFGPEGDEGP